MARLTLTSPRLMSPDSNSAFQSIKVDLRSEITLVSALISFKALIIHVFRFVFLLLQFLMTA